MKVPLLVCLVSLELLVVSGRPEGDASTATDPTLKFTDAEKTSLSNEGRTFSPEGTAARSSYDPWDLIRERYPDFDSNKPGDEYFRCWLLNNNATVRCIFRDGDPEDTNVYDIEEGTMHLYESFLQTGEPPLIVTQATTPSTFLQWGLTYPTIEMEIATTSEETSINPTSERSTEVISIDTTEFTISEDTTKSEVVLKDADSGKHAGESLGRAEEGNGYPSNGSWTDHDDSKECCCSNDLKDLRTKDVMVTPPVYRNYSIYRNESSENPPFDVNGENVHVIPFSVQISICRPIACPRSNLVPVCHQRHKQVELTVLSLDKSTVFRENIYVEDGCSCVLRGTEEVFENEKYDYLLKLNKVTPDEADNFTNSSKVFDDTIDSVEQFGPLKRNDGNTGDKSLQLSRPLELQDSDVATPVIPVIDDNNRPKFTSHVVDGVTTLVLPTKAEELITTSEPDYSTLITRTNIVDGVTNYYIHTITMNPQTTQSVEASLTPANDQIKSYISKIADGITTVSIINPTNTAENLKDDQRSSVVKPNFITKIFNGVMTFISDSLSASAASTSVSTKTDPTKLSTDSIHFDIVTLINDGWTSFSTIPASTISTEITTTTPVGQTTSDIPSVKPATSSDDSEPSSVLTQTVDGTVFLYKILSTSEPSFSTNPLVAQDRSTDSFTNTTTILTSTPTPLNQSPTTQIIDGLSRFIFGPSSSKFPSENCKTVIITKDLTAENSPSATLSVVTTTLIYDGKKTIIYGPSTNCDYRNSPSGTPSVVTTTQVEDIKTKLILDPSPSDTPFLVTRTLVKDVETTLIENCPFCEFDNFPHATLSLSTRTQVKNGLPTLILSPSPSSDSENFPSATPSLVTRTQINDGLTTLFFGPSPSSDSENSPSATPSLLVTKTQNNVDKLTSIEECTPPCDFYHFPSPSHLTRTRVEDGRTTMIAVSFPSSDSEKSPSATTSLVTRIVVIGPSPSSFDIPTLLTEIITIIDGKTTVFIPNVLPSATASVVTTTQINDGKTTLISGPSPSSVSESSTLSSPSLLTTTFIIDGKTTLIVRPAVLPTRVVPEEVRTTNGDGNSKVSLPDKLDLNGATFCSTNMTEFLRGSPLSDEKMGTILCGMEQEIKELLNTEPMQTFHTCLNSTFLNTIMAKIKSKPHDFDGVKFLEMAQELFSVHYESLAKKNSADLRFPGETVWRHFASSYILDDIDDNVMSLCRLQLDTSHVHSILANLFLPESSPLLNTVVKISSCANLHSDCKALAGEKLVRRLAAAHLIGKRAEEHNMDVSSILEAKILLVQEAKEALEWSKQTIFAIDYSDPTIALLISYREMLLPYVKLYTNHCNAEKKSVPFGVVSATLTPSFIPFVPGGTVKATPTIHSQYSASITPMRVGQPIKMNHDYLYKVVSGRGR